MANSILVDTSIWVDHFRNDDAHLATLLSQDALLVHPLIIAEIACGTPPDRARTLSDLAQYRSLSKATVEEVREFIEKHPAFGKGCGVVDIALLVSVCQAPNTLIWTRDKRLKALAASLGLAYTPA